MIDLLAAQSLHGDYPHTWDDFIGQEGVKRQLRVACQSARARGEPLSHTLLASGQAGIGKCLGGDTLLTLADGSRVRIDGLNGWLPELLSLNGDLRLRPQRPTGFLVRPPERVLRLTLATGRTIRATGDHRFFDGAEWRELSDFSPGELLATPRVLPVFGQRALNDYHVDLMALLLADGNCTGNAVRYYKTEPAMIVLCDECAKEAGDDGLRWNSPKEHYQVVGPHQRVREFVKAQGLDRSSRDKVIPDAVFRLPREQLARFLAVLWCGDGTIHDSSGGGTEISYSSASRVMAEQIQHLWLRFGVVSFVRHKRNRAVKDGPLFASWELRVATAFHQAFKDAFGEHAVGEKARKLDKLEPRNLNTNVDVLPPAAAEVFPTTARAGYRRGKSLSRGSMAALMRSAREAERWATSDVFWDQVESIEPDGVEETYCLQMDTDPNFVANDIVVHNTALALLTTAEVGADLRVVSGRMSANQARIVLAGMRDRDVLFIDEIHRLVEGGKRHAEWLLHLLTDGVLMGPTGPERQPRVTVIGATTDVGRLPEVIVGRFDLRPSLVPYTDEEAQVISIRMAGRIFDDPLALPSVANHKAIARAANNNPRTIGSILRNLRDLATVDSSVWDGEHYDITEALAWLGLTPDGLTDTACRYLTVLLTEFAGQAGERALIDRLQEPGGLGQVEQALMQKKLIAKTRSGRVLTRAGIQRARHLQGQEQS